MSKGDLVATLGAGALNPLFASLRYEIENGEYYKQAIAEGPIIYALWHGRLLPMAYHHRNQGVATLISRSADGDYLAAFLERWGYVPVRGSSSRGGMEAVRQLVRVARSGHSLAITPDGPRGPMQQLKPGIIVTAQLSGLPILPVSGTANRGWWPGKWDRFLIPKPFATMRMRYGPPVRIPRDASEADIEKYRAELEATLNRLTAEVDAR
jgi:lysophospholipid acyltransferase (LPLAT)-like uncharacterized protein